MQVEVDGNLESAIRHLRKAMEKDGIHRTIKMRELSPNRTERKKAKALIAARRRRQIERRRELREHERTNRKFS